MQLPTTYPLIRTLACLMLVVAGTAGESANLTASTVTPAVNQQVTVTVRLDGAAPFSVWGETVRFDQAKLRLDAQAGGTISTFVPDARALADINASGEVHTGGYTQAAGPTYPDQSGGNGTVAVLTFTRIAAGSTALSAPLTSGATPFGCTVLTAAGLVRLPQAAADLILTDPASGGGGAGGSTGGSSSGGGSKCGIGGGIATLMLSLRLGRRSEIRHCEVRSARCEVGRQTIAPPRAFTRMRNSR